MFDVRIRGCVFIESIEVLFFGVGSLAHEYSVLHFLKFGLNLLVYGSLYIESSLRHAFFCLLELQLQLLEKRADFWLDREWFLLGFLLFYAINSVIKPFRFFLFEIEVDFELSCGAVLFKLIKLVKHIIIVVIMCNGNGH